MAAEQFSLCWDNFHSNMSNGLSSLLKSEDLVDVTLAAEGRYLKAHKMVLSVCSPYFRELFQVNPCKHPIVFLKDVSFTALNNLLEFMYQGEVKVSQDDLGTFIKTAEALKIKGLTGEGSSQNDTENDSAVQTNSFKSEHTPTPNRKSTREKSPPARKKMLGPASKRFKPSDNDSPTPQPQSQAPALVTIKPQQQTQTPDTKDMPPEPQQIMHFKMEPEETAVSLQNEDDLHNQYEDSTMDDIGMDSTTDYMLDTTDPIDVKAGTSTSTATDNTEAAGENQGLYYVLNQKSLPHLILDNCKFAVLVRRGQYRYWRCSSARNYKCKAICITDNGKMKKYRGLHNHPPHYNSFNIPSKLYREEQIYDAFDRSLPNRRHTHTFQ